jgi:hypothetical protein
MPFEFEEDRQHYLQQFGITTWYIRSNSDGASLSNAPYHNDSEGESLVSESVTRQIVSLSQAERGNDHSCISVEGGKQNQIKSFDKADKASGLSITRAIPGEILEATEDEIQAVSDTNNCANVTFVPREFEVLSDPDAALTKETVSAQEVWCRFCPNESKPVDRGEFTFLAKLSFEDADAERLLLQNIIKVFLKLKDIPQLDEFCWPPFSQDNIPLQNENTRLRLLARWLGELADSQLIVFSEEIVCGLPTGSYCPSLKSIILHSQSKHEIWNRLQTLVGAR